MNIQIQQEFIEEIKKLKDEIKKQNEIAQTHMNTQINTTINEKTIWHYIKRYLQELFEASISLIVVMFVTKKQFPLFDFARIVLLIGTVTLILEEYNHEYLNNFKQGIHFTLGSLAFAN